jgi:hypothetical protein
MQAALGQFFGARFRSGVLFGIYEQSGDRRALSASLDMYRRARSHWVQLIETSKGVYMADITIGEEPQQRGNWADRLPAIDKDIAALAQRLDAASADSPKPQVTAAIEEAMGRPQRPKPAVQHKPAANFVHGQPLEITLSLNPQASSVSLYYRHVDQAERYTVQPMQAGGREYRATIPANYTEAAYPLQYYFEIKEGVAKASLYPGFSTNLTGQPYFVVSKV